jgi:5-methylcytosine-specific restriction endonuclease McrA
VSLKDPEKRREYQRQWRAKARAEGRVPKIVKSGDSATYSRFRAWQNKAAWVDKLGGRCHNCGYAGSFEALDFDHIDQSAKTGDISRLLGGSDDTALAAEMSKCQLLCANCHREKTRTEQLLKTGSVDLNTLTTGDLIQIVWADVLEDPTGPVEEAKVATRTTYGVFCHRKRGMGGAPPYLVVSNTLDDPETGNQSGWTAFPEGMLLSVKFVRGRSNKRAHKRNKDYAKVEEGKKEEGKKDGSSIA